MFTKVKDTGAEDKSDWTYTNSWRPRFTVGYSIKSLPFSPTCNTVSLPRRLCCYRSNVFVYSCL